MSQEGESTDDLELPSPTVLVAQYHSLQRKLEDAPGYRELVRQLELIDRFEGRQAEEFTITVSHNGTE